MPGTAIRFKNPYQNYSPSTIFQVDPATKTLNPFGSGDAYTQAGFQFGQERLVEDPNEFAGFGVGPIINGRAAGLQSVTDQLNQIQNSEFNQQTQAPKRAAATLQEQIEAGTKGVADQMAEFNSLVEKYKGLQQPNYQQAFTDARTQAGIPGLEQDFVGVRQQRRELPYVQRAGSGNAGVMTEGQLGANVQQADIPLEAREANLIDRLQLASDFVSQSLKFKELDANVARTALENAINLATQGISLQRSSLEDARSQRDKEQARQDQALQFRLENDIKTPFFNSGGTIYDAGNLEPIPDEATFQQRYGMALPDAEARGLVTKLEGGVQQERALVLELASQYPDAFISPGDTLAQAQGKIKNSRIYQEQVRPPMRAGGGSGPGTLAGTSIVDANTDAAVRNIIASRPGDGGYGDTYNAVKAKFGEAVANSYDKVFQDVFNKGVSVDAAFNNLKLGSSNNGLVDSSGKPLKLSPGQQTNIAEWTTLSELAQQTLQLGERTGFSGVGGGYQGSIQQFMAKNFGTGSPDDEQLRNYISNIQGTLAKARGGTSFTESEKRLLQSYTPTINDSPLVLKSKLNSLQNFIGTTLGSIYKSAGAANVADVITQPDGTMWQKNQDGSYTQIK